MSHYREVSLETSVQWLENKIGAVVVTNVQCLLGNSVSKVVVTDPLGLPQLDSDS